MMDEPPEPTAATLNDIVQALKAKAAYDVLFADGRRRATNLPDMTARLEGVLPNAYDIVGAGAYLETVRRIRGKAQAALRGETREPGTDEPFDWDRVTSHELLKTLETLTVSMSRGKGRREGVDIAKTTPMAEGRSRWSWRRSE